MKRIPSIQIDIETEWRGGQYQVEMLCKGLFHRGHPVTLITRPESILGNKLEEAGIEVVRIPARFEFDPVAVYKVAAEIKKRRPAIVGMHASHSHTLGVLAKRLCPAFSSYIVTRRVDFVPGQDPLNRWKYTRGPDGWIAISNAIRRILLTFGIPSDRIHVIHSGIPSRKIPSNARRELIEELGIKEDRILIGNIANLVDHKGHKFLLDAIPAVIEKHPEVLFLIAGEGQLEKALKQQAKNLGLTEKHLRLLGYRTDVEKILGALDLFAMSSHLEGLCTSIIDAHHSGIPVIASAAGGIPELVIDGETGFLADNQSPESIAEKIQYVLDHPKEAEKIVKRAKDRAARKFSDDSMVEGTLDVYHKILGAR